MSLNLFVRVFTLLPLLGLASARIRANESLGIPIAQLGAGDAASMIAPTPAGARLRAALQDIEGEATADGLWLCSTADEDAGKTSRFQVKATALGRARVIPLAATGSVRVSADVAAFLRPALVEEFRVSADGVRQDFVVLERPAGAGELSVMLAVAGASAEAAACGAKLTLAGSGRVLAYHRLHVSDAAGRVLAATMEVTAPDRLRVAVDDAAAVYPVRIDPTFSDADWTSLGTLPGASSTVRAMAADGAGNLYVGGEFTAVGDVTANRIAKWNGSAWSALGAGVNFPVNALALSGSSVIAGGAFTAAGGAGANYIAAWNPATSTWSALGAGMDAPVRVLAVSGSDVFAGGDFTTAGGASASRVAKWNGSAWSALGAGMDGAVLVLAVSGSEVFAGGDFTTAGGTSASNIAKWSGSAWSALGSGISGQVHALAVSGTDLLAGGVFLSAGGVGANYIARWDGSAWSALDAGTGGAVHAITISGGDVFAGGSFTIASGVPATNLAKWNGAAWSALGSGTNAPVNALLVNGSDVYAGGDFITIGGVAANRIAKWNGSTWAALGAGVNDRVRALALENGEIYVGGDFTTAGGASASRIAKWNPTTSTWSALGAGVNGSVYALTVGDAFATDVYVGGTFSSAGGSSTGALAVWNGSSWGSVGSTFMGSVYAMAFRGIGSPSELYVGGSFTDRGRNVARYDTILGTWVWSGSDGVNGSVHALAVDGNNVYVGGAFISADGVSASRVAKWSTTSSTWSALGSGMDFTVQALTMVGSDVYAGGAFSTAGGASASGIAKWNGSAWSALGSGTNGPVNALAVSGDDLFVGGSFSTAGGKVSARAARANVGQPRPILTLGSASAIGGATATLGGTVNPNGATTTAQFEYGPTTAYGSSASAALSPADGDAAQAVSANISGLAANTTYHFRLTATNSGGAASTSSSSFTTLDADANLAGLTIGSGTLVPAFASGTTSYAATVGHATASLTVTPTVASAGATVEVNAVPVASGSPSGPVAIAVGSNVISIVVTAADTVTTKTYAIAVLRTVSDTTKPVVTLTAPAASTVAGSFTIAGTVRELVGLASLTVRLNGVALPLDAPLASDAGPALAWSVSGVAPENGSNAIVVEALDYNGNIGVAMKTVAYTNPALAVLGGAYQALLVPTGTPHLDTTGLVTVTVAATGAFTGKAQLGGVSVPFSGVLKNDGAARFKPALGTRLEVIDRTEFDSYLGALALAVSSPAGMSGTLSTQASGGSVLATFAGATAPYSSANLVPAVPFLNQPTRGIYAVAFPSKAQTPSLDAHLYPQGAGYAALTISNTGSVSLAGFLADGAKLAVSGRLRADGSVALFAPLYRRLGAFAGELAFSNGTDTDASGADFLWLRPERPRARYYPAGWEAAGIRVDAIGAKHSATASLDFGQGAADAVTGNASLVFTDGLLGSPLTHAVSVDPLTGAVKLIPAATTAYTLKLAASTGIFSGAFTHPGTGRESFRGILLDKGANQGGFGYFLSTPPLSYGASGEGGGVFLDPAGP